ALIDAIAGDTRLMPHLHLSLQAGDDMILKRMKRRHLREDAIRFCQDIRAARPEIVYGADLIAGFPTETEAMFENSLKLVEECGLTWLHVFPYSPRLGTPAARMPQLPKAEIKARAARLRSVGDRAKADYVAGQVGRDHRVLIERLRMGRTETFAEVAFDSDQPVGDVVHTRVSGVDPRGHLIA
ncbi:MAG: radical SAM protein, partial [Pseudomonadota bacterium]